jgi:hypothetical protein
MKRRAYSPFTLKGCKNEKTPRYILKFQMSKLEDFWWVLKPNYDYLKAVKLWQEGDLDFVTRWESIFETDEQYERVVSSFLEKKKYNKNRLQSILLALINKKVSDHLILQVIKTGVEVDDFHLHVAVDNPRIFDALVKAKKQFDEDILEVIGNFIIPSANMDDLLSSLQKRGVLSRNMFHIDGGYLQEFLDDVSEKGRETLAKYFDLP